MCHIGIDSHHIGIYPKLIFLAPQAFLVYFILSSYPKRKAPEKLDTKDKIKQKIAKATTDKKPLEDASTSKRTQHDTPNVFPFNLSALFQPASDESAEYLKNLQNIQNTMGEFSDVYDWIMMQANQFNWSSEEKTMRILQLMIVSSVLIAFVLYVVPIKFIFLSFGLLVYGLNTRFAKYVLNEVQPYMVQFGRRNTMALLEWYADLEKRLENQDHLQEISVFENQRWWPRRGYLHEVSIRNDWKKDIVSHWLVVLYLDGEWWEIAMVWFYGSHLYANHYWDTGTQRIPMEGDEWMDTGYNWSLGRHISWNW